MSGPRDASAASSVADPEIDELYGAFSPAILEAMVVTVRELRRTTPAPAHDPYYGLDRRGGPSLRLLERLTRHGDFRKYVSVLDAGAGLGGVARWLALRYGCRVVALDRSPAAVAAGHRLTRRARLAERVHGVAGSFEAVPARDGAFTQIWSVEALQHARDLGRALRELFRVLRPGSPLALHEVVRRAASVPSLGGAWRHGTRDDYLDALAAAGFADIECDDVTAERTEPPPLVASVDARLERILRSRLAAGDAWWRALAAARRADAVVAGPDYRVVQLFARRPST
jgi:SAM-dependent methyltransferase